MNSQVLDKSCILLVEELVVEEASETFEGFVAEVDYNYLVVASHNDEAVAVAAEENSNDADEIVAVAHGKTHGKVHLVHLPHMPSSCHQLGNRLLLS